MTEVWTYIIIACVASIAMILQNALGNSPIAASLPWRIAAHAYEAHFGKSMVSIEGVVVLILATMLTFTCTVGVYKLTSKWLNIPFKNIFLVTGYAIAPLVIFGGMAQTIPFFFTHYAYEAINGVVLLLDPNATPWQAYVTKQKGIVCAIPPKITRGAMAYPATKNIVLKGMLSHLDATL